MTRGLLSSQKVERSRKLSHKVSTLRQDFLLIKKGSWLPLTGVIRRTNREQLQSQGKPISFSSKRSLERLKRGWRWRISLKRTLLVLCSLPVKDDFMLGTRG